MRCIAGMDSYMASSVNTWTLSAEDFLFVTIVTIGTY
jgi:hypothetical protein